MSSSVLDDDDETEIFDMGKTSVVRIWFIDTYKDYKYCFSIVNAYAEWLSSKL